MEAQSVRKDLKVQVDFLGAEGRLLGHDLLPLAFGQNASPPGLNV